MYRRLEVVSRKLEWLGLEHRTTSRRMLERLAGNSNPEPLERFDEVLAPINCYVRRRVHFYTSLTPLNRLVDATPPESDTAREFAGMMEHWQADKEKIRKQLTLWRENRTELISLMQRSALLQEAIPLAEDVSALAAAGLEALDYLEAGKPAQKDWRAKQQALFDRAAKPRVELMIMIVPSIRKLVAAAQAGL